MSREEIPDLQLGQPEPQDQVPALVSGRGVDRTQSGLDGCGLLLCLQGHLARSDAALPCLHSLRNFAVGVFCAEFDGRDGVPRRQPRSALEGAGSSSRVSLRLHPHQHDHAPDRYTDHLYCSVDFGCGTFGLGHPVARSAWLPVPDHLRVYFHLGAPLRFLPRPEAPHESRYPDLVLWNAGDLR